MSSDRIKVLLDTDLKDISTEGLRIPLLERALDGTLPEEVALNVRLLVDAIQEETLAAIRDLGVTVGTELYRFSLSKDLARVKEDDRLWIGLLPRKLDERTYGLIEKTAHELASKKVRQLLENGEVFERAKCLDQLRKVFQVGICRVLKDNFDAAVKVAGIDIEIGKVANSPSHASIEELERAFKVVQEMPYVIKGNIDEFKFVELLKVLGVVDRDVSLDEQARLVEEMADSVTEAIEIFTGISTTISQGYNRLFKRRLKKNESLIEDCENALATEGEETELMLTEDLGDDAFEDGIIDAMSHSLLQDLGPTLDDDDGENPFRNVDNDDIESLLELLTDEAKLLDQMQDFDHSIPTIVLYDEPEDINFFRLLRIVFNPKEEDVDEVERINEAQILAFIAYLVFLMKQKPSAKAAAEKGDEILSSLKDLFYNDFSRFIPTEFGDYVYIGRSGKELSDDERLIRRRGSRQKERISRILKAIKKRQEIDRTSDTLAMQAELIGITSDMVIETGKSIAEAEKVRARKRFIEDCLTEVAQCLNLSKASPELHYSKIPEGTFTIVTRTGEPNPDNPDTQDFPNFKVYMAIPIDGQCVRMEYRLIPSDVWRRSEEGTDTMSYHKNYKLKKVLKLAKIILRQSDHADLIRLSELLLEVIEVRQKQEALLKRMDLDPEDLEALLGIQS